MGGIAKCNAQRTKNYEDDERDDNEIFCADLSSFFVHKKRYIVKVLKVLVFNMVMKSRSTFLGVFIVVVVLVASAHLFIHFAFYGTGLQGFAEKGITGFATEGSETVGGFPFSEIILFLEWGLIFLGIIFVYAKYRFDFRKELNYLVTLKQKKNFGSATELDNFYELLKEMKHFRLAAAAQTFNVDFDVVEDWAKSLEAAKVAELTYPRIGGPEVHLIEGALKKEEVGESNTDETNEKEEDKNKK